SGARVVLVDHYYFAFAADQVLYVSLGLWVYVKFVSPGGASWSRTLLPRAKIGKLVSFGLFPWVSGFLMRAVMKLDYWFVEEFAGLESLGLYSVASNIGETLFLIPNTVGLVVLSFVADPATREDSTHRTASATRLFFFAMIVGSLVLALVSSQLFAFAFGEEFRASGPLLNRLLWGIVPFSLANIIIGYLLGTKRLKPVVVSASIGLAILLTLDFALVPRMGASGAAVGRAVAFNAMALYLVVHFKHASGMPYRRFLLPSLADIQLIKGLIHKLLGRQRT
ncbi:MAG: polysaccharide biosynthesis C-terminal domain-containing protein, partial [Deltaproteobacteria bacterium]|nr:polysaccharide biosynthesis C-terminal domain-containing protein [Deltaproteobacteria bacterium]